MKIFASVFLACFCFASKLAEKKLLVELSKSTSSFTERFDIKSFLGRGAFASVFRCTEKISGKEFVIKIVEAAYDNQVDRSKAKHEAEIWSTIRHKNIVTLHKTFHQENEICIVMELIGGKTLFDEILNKTSFTERRACFITFQVSNFRSAFFFLKVSHNRMLGNIGGRKRLKERDRSVAFI